MMAEPRRGRPEGCASDLDLEELLAGDLSGKEEARLRDHIAGCPRCQARRASLAAEPALTPSPEALKVAASAPAGRTRRPVLRILGAAAGMAALTAAGVLTWNLGRGAPGEEVGEGRVKGSVALTLFVKRQDGRVDGLNGAGEIQPGEEMRFSIASGEPGHAVVLGLDAAPSVTVYQPAGGGKPVPLAASGGTLLDGSIVADATGGNERIFAVVCRGPVAPDLLRRKAESALRAAGGRPDMVQSLDLAGLGCADSFVTLRKR